MAISTLDVRAIEGAPHTLADYWSDLASQPLWQFGRSVPSFLAAGEDAGMNFSRHSTDARDVIAFGPGALRAAVSGLNLIAIGGNTMSRGQPGDHNIAIGNSALTNVDGGNRNIGFGSLALHFLTTGAFNVFGGRDSGHAITSGNNNTGWGYRACGVGNNPVGFDGKITANQQITASDMSGFGMDALRYSNGQFNSGFGKIALFNIKNGARNVGFGAGALTLLDVNTSYSNKVLDWTPKSGTYSQTGSIVTVSISGANAVVGNQVLMDFATGAYAGISGIAVTVVAAPDANTFTFVSPVSQTVSGNCSIQWVETAATVGTSDRNSALGHNAGGSLERGSFNLFLGADSGTGQGTTYSNKLLVHINSANARPLMAGDFALGTLVIGGGVADATTPFGVMQAGKRILDLERSASVSRLSAYDDGAASGPVWELMRESVSPAASDLLGALRWRGRDSAGNDTNFADLFGTILSPTDGAESAQLTLRAMVAGAMSAVVQFGSGILVGAPTGGFQGAGTINLDNALYRDGVQVVGGRDTGWAAFTGTTNKATAYATGSVTLVQLAERVAALQAALTTHGLTGA